MLLGKKLFGILSIIIILTLLTGTTLAKSVYAIIDRASTIRAYKIIGEEIEEQTDVKNLDDHGGAVGLALDPDSETLFVTYEHSNIIEMVNAKTMISEENPVTVMEANNLSGMTFDQSKQKLYVVDRTTDRLFVYLWNSRTKTLILEGGTYKTLADLGGEGAYGIALDESNNRLFVTNATKTVHYYDSNDPNWAHKGSIDIVVGDVNKAAVGIAIDPNRQYLYTGSWSGQSGDHPFLVRADINDINNPVFTDHNVGKCVIGIAADQDTGLVYVTTKKSGDDIEVYNTSTFPSDPCYTETADIDQPADIVVRGDVSYKPPDFYFEKIDVNETNCVIPDDYITYEITYGPNGVDHNNVVITDYLPPEVDYVSSVPEPNEILDSNTIIWNIGDLSANDPCDSVTLTVRVNECIPGCGIITNFCEAESDSAYNTAEANTPVCSASSPEPTCGEIVDLDTGEFNLTWCPGLFAADVNGHEVYFGSNFNEVHDANTSDPNVYKGTVTNPSYPIEFNSLDMDTTYYWRIDEVNTNHPDVRRWKGGVWSFTTGTFLIVDDFDSYANDLELWNVWHDVITGGVNSYVFLETGVPNANLVHDGNSMKYEYGNKQSPYYAEAYVDTVNLPSQIGSDWTVSGVKALVLYLYGQSGNDANEQMYVRLQDADSNAVVTYGDYGEDPNDLRIEEWHEWIIDLEDFNSAGMDLTNVTRITIGFGDGYAPSGSGSGTVYFDDIRLYLRRCIPGYESVGDFEPDCDVDFYDFAIFGLAWLTSLGQQNYNPVCDISEPSNIINEYDLASFCENWLWQEGGEVSMASGTGLDSGLTEVLNTPALPEQFEPEPQPEVTEEQEPYPSPPAPLTSAMPLSLQISVNGDPEPVDSEIILSQSETLILDIWTTAEIYSQGGLEGYFVIGVDPMYGTISGGVTIPPWNAEASVALYGGNSGNAYLPVPEQGILGAIGTFLPQGFGITGVIFDQIVFHCEAPGDAVINLYVTDFVTLTLVDSVTVHQIPEQ